MCVIIIGVSKWTGENDKRIKTIRYASNLYEYGFINASASRSERDKKPNDIFSLIFMRSPSSFYRWQMPLTTCVYVFIKLKEQFEEKHLLTHSHKSSPKMEYSSSSCGVLCVCVCVSAFMIFICFRLCSRNLSLSLLLGLKYVTVISIYFNILLTIRAI